MSYKFEYGTTEFRARCIAVEGPEHILLNVDTGFNGYRIIAFKLHGVQDTKEEAVDFLWDTLEDEESNSEWPLSIRSYIDPDDNSNYLVKVRVEDYSKGVREIICVNDLLVQQGYSQVRTY